MKGIISIIELLIAGVIISLALLHFFPRYVIETSWERALLIVRIRDALNSMDRLGQTYELANAPKNDFDDAGMRLFGLDSIVWREVKGLPDAPSEPIPSFTKASKESIVDVEVIEGEYYVYSFTLGLGRPY